MLDLRSDDAQQEEKVVFGHRRDLLQSSISPAELCFRHSLPLFCRHGRRSLSLMETSCKIKVRSSKQINYRRNF